MTLKSLNMKKAILEVGGMLSVLDFLGVEKRLKRTANMPALRAITAHSRAL
jgi:hypothetical protein